MRMKGRHWDARRRTAVAIRHVAFEDLGNLAQALDARGWEISYCEASTDQLSHRSIRDADLVIVLGGPVGVGDAPAYPFLAREMNLIERRLARMQPVLGIGLGAQLMAAVLGAHVRPNERCRIGWEEITLTPEGASSALAPLAGIPVLHWQGDTFDLPSGAVRLAHGAEGESQAFSHGKAGLALQFHLEADRRELEEWYVGHALKLSSAGVDLRRLRRAGHLHAPVARKAAHAVLDGWLEEIFPDHGGQDMKAGLTSEKSPGRGWQAMVPETGSRVGAV